MNGAKLGAKYSVSAGNVDQTVGSAAAAEANEAYVWPTSTGTPRCSRYQAASACGSRALKKMPPMPRTRSMQSPVSSEGSYCLPRGTAAASGSLADGVGGPD